MPYRTARVEDGVTAGTVFHVDVSALLVYVFSVPWHSPSAQWVAVGELRLPVWRRFAALRKSHSRISQHAHISLVWQPPADLTYRLVDSFKPFGYVFRALAVDVTQ